MSGDESDEDRDRDKTENVKDSKRQTRRQGLYDHDPRRYNYTNSVDGWDDHLPKDRLTRREVEELRAFLESHKRTKWFWSTVRIWITWISGAIIGIYAVWDHLGKLLRKILI